MTTYKFSVHNGGNSFSVANGRGQSELEAAMDAARGRQVPYTAPNGYSYQGALQPDSAEFSESILGGRGGIRVFGNVDGIRSEIWLRREGAVSK